MQHALFDFGGTALVPELGADVTAGAAGDVHGILVAVAAVRALPDELAVILDDLNLTVVAALLAIIALGVKLGVPLTFATPPTSVPTSSL